jgi:hypothetical protein
MGVFITEDTLRAAKRQYNEGVHDNTAGNSVNATEGRHRFRVSGAAR